ARLLTANSGESMAEALAIAFSPDGRLLACGFKDGTIRLWTVADGREASRPLGGYLPLAQLAFSPDGETLAAGNPGGGVNLWSVTSGLPKDPVRGHEGRVYGVAFSPDGRWLASGGFDQTVQLVDRASGQRVPTFRSDTAITSLTFSPDSRTLAAGSAAPGPFLYLWDLTSKEVPKRL